MAGNVLENIGNNSPITGNRMPLFLEEFAAKGIHTV